MCLTHRIKHGTSFTILSMSPLLLGSHTGHSSGAARLRLQMNKVVITMRCSNSRVNPAKNFAERRCHENVTCSSHLQSLGAPACGVELFPGWV